VEYAYLAHVIMSFVRFTADSKFLKPPFWTTAVLVLLWYGTLYHVIDRLSTGGNAIASVRPSVRPSVSLLTFEASDLFDLDFLHVYGWPVWRNGKKLSSLPVCFHVTAFGKMLTRMCLCHQEV